MDKGTEFSNFQINKSCQFGPYKLHWVTWVDVCQDKEKIVVKPKKLFFIIFQSFGMTGL